MSRHSTYYDLFGVPPSASLREIRVAYIQLMKRYHPDSGHSGATGAPDIVARANRYYAVLKNAEKRAAYDGELLRAARANRSLITGQREHRRRPPRSPVLALGVAVAALGGAAIGIVDAPRGVAADESPLDTAWSDRALSSPVPMPSAEQVAKIVRRAIAMRDAPAVTVSQQCYANARATASEAAAQDCVIFDEAALYSSLIRHDNVVAATYFNPDLVRLRQSAALSPFDGDQGRLEQLRTKALLQLFDEARVENEAAEPEASPSTG